MSKEQFDKIVNKWISRKLLVFLVACGGLFAGVITSGDWVIVSATYIVGTVIEEKINGRI